MFLNQNSICIFFWGKKLFSPRKIFVFKYLSYLFSKKVRQMINIMFF